jgi:alpha/beta superfamily hydrolase
MKKLFFYLCLTVSAFVNAQAHASSENPYEQLVTVDLQGGSKQEGVLSLKNNSSQPTHLAVLLPGYPSVVRPVVENNEMISSRLKGNFLIRARQHLINNELATLVVDCRSDSGDYCSSSYQASLMRYQDVAQLVQLVKQMKPSIKNVWIVGTSMGTVSSSFMSTYEPYIYNGAIHTASITEPYSRNSYRELGGFDYKKSKIPQIFIHHRDDPCHLTTYSGAKSITDKFGLALVTVTGSSNTSGPACNAFTEHGFRGKEKEVMTAIQKIISTGKVDVSLID